MATVGRGGERPPGFENLSNWSWNGGCGGLGLGGQGGSPNPRDGSYSSWRQKKLNLPTFDGNNPDGWILRAKRYFDFYRQIREEKIEPAIVAFEGEVLLWYQWEHCRRPIHRWEDLRQLLLRNFRTTYSGSLYEQWLSFSQIGSVGEYRRAFIESIAPLDNVPEPSALG